MRVAVYFVATPLHYLAARRVAQDFERGARQVLLWYRPGAQPAVRAADWHAAAYLPWPRWDPLPGPFGRHRQLRKNIRLVAGLVGRCDELVLHSPVFDTEAVNYFLRALPRACGATTLQARILPDGLGNTMSQPLGLARRAAQWLRKLRRLAAPELDYWVYTGDRIGADAPFCDRIYVLPGFPHPYPAHKVVTLPPLAEAAADTAPRQRRALVLGQPLVGSGLTDATSLAEITAAIREWLRAEGVSDIRYKPHPRDPRHELAHPDYSVVELDEPLETWMSREPHDLVAGVHSTGLLMARQIYGGRAQVRGFGWDRIRFRSAAQEQQLRAAFTQGGVTIV
ncbi:MAG TPA: polysialyltransferase family glycosyltransferase [Methylibium sp.]|nr:polysialyltransferase family glycosyltransferase [Methylibium sp.]